MKTLIKAAAVIMLSSGPIFAQQVSTVKALQQVSPISIYDKNPIRSKESLKAPATLDGRFNGKSVNVDFHSLKSKSNNSVLQGGADPGGGGFIRKDGKILTMQEAGYILSQEANDLAPTSKDYPIYYSFDAQTKEALKQILAALPGGYSKDTLYSQIISTDDRSTFIKLSVIDNTIYVKLKGHYQSVVKSFGLKLDESALFFPAFSKDGKTYILPSFQSLTPYQQALNLIHEYFMRSAINREPIELLSFVMQTDSAIHVYLHSTRLIADKVKFSVAMQKIRNNTLSNSELLEQDVQGKFRNLISQIEEKIQRPLLASELFLQPKSVYEILGAQFDPSLVKKFDTLVPLVAEKLEKKTCLANPSLKPKGEYGLGSHDENYDDALDIEIYSSRITGISIKDGNELKRKIKAMLNEQCQTHGDLTRNSDVGGDLLIHVDKSITGLIFAIECRETSNGTTSRGTPLALK